MMRLWTGIPHAGRRMTRVLACGAGAVLLAAALPVNDANIISLSVEPTSGRAQVVIGVKGSVSVKHFTLREPERIVVDITGATLGLARNGYDRVARGGVLDVRYAQNQPNVVRVVLTLAGSRRYDVERNGSDIRITVDGGGEFVAWHVGVPGGRAVAMTAAASEAASEAASVSAEAFAAPPAAASPVRQETAPPTVRRVPPPVLPAAAAPAPATVAERDVAYGRPTVGYASPSLRPQQVPAQQPRRRISIVWERADIRDVLAQFANFSGRTIIPSREVEGTISAEIINQPWDVAMKAILNANGFDAVEDENGIIIVSTIQALAQRPRTEALTTRTIRLNYTDAASVAATLRDRLSRDCSAGQGPGVAASPAAGAPISPLNCPVRGAVTADSLTNSVSVTDVPSVMEDLLAYARSLDIRQPQVNIKAKIILVDRTRLEGLGLKYDLGTRFHHFNEIVQRSDTAGVPQEANIFTLGGNTLAAIANAGRTVPSAALKIVYSAALGAYDFTTFLEALQEVSLLDVQAEPSVTTLNYRQAVLTAGTQVPIRTIEQGAGSSAVGGAPRVTVSFRQTGVVLRVTPSITNNRQIKMVVHAENSDVQFVAGDVGAVFPTQSVDNELLVADGETAVMGGLTQTSVNYTKTGIPILVDLPFIGRLFGVTNRTEIKRDLLILITPHIVDEGDMSLEPRRLP